MSCCILLPRLSLLSQKSLCIFVFIALLSGRCLDRFRRFISLILVPFGNMILSCISCEGDLEHLMSQIHRLLFSFWI